MENKTLDNIVVSLIKEHVGGQKFFDALDEEIRSTEEILKDVMFRLIPEIDRSTMIIMSGKFGKVFYQYLHSRKYVHLFANNYIKVVVGGLRSGAQIDDLSYVCQYDPKITSAIFVDDSFYSGRTRDVINKELNKYNINIDKTIVVYDGSKANDKSIISLYQYYNKKSNV